MHAFDHAPIMGVIQNKIAANGIVLPVPGAMFDDHIIIGLKNGGHTGPRDFNNLQSKKCQNFLEDRHSLKIWINNFKRRWVRGGGPFCFHAFGVPEDFSKLV